MPVMGPWTLVLNKNDWSDNEMIEKTTIARLWDDEDYKAHDGWTIHFGPLLKGVSKNRSVEEAATPPPTRPAARKGKRRK